jgi:isopropylmalate/homocitrate/citramalate synthase
MVIEYASLRGTADGMDLKVITEIAEYFEDELQYVIPPRTPFIGRSFNATRAGIHADGLIKNEEIYNIFNTTALLNRPPHVSISNTSGLAGIAYWLNDYYELPEGHKVEKSDSLVAAMKNMIDEEYKNGRNSIMGDDELDNMVRLIDKIRHKALLLFAE